MRVPKKQLLLCLMLAGVWFCAASWLWPFDFDEAYYVRVAEEILASRNWVVPTYQGELTAFKPPTFSWLIALAQMAFGNGNTISPFVARLPSIVATLTMIIVVTARAGVMNALSLGFFVWGAMLLPTLGGASVLIDPVFSLCLAVVFVVMDDVVARDKKLVFAQPSEKQSIVVVFAMTMACMLKGPVGMVIPAGAVFLNAVWRECVEREKLSVGARIFFVARGCICFWREFVLCTAFTSFYYIYLYNNGASKLVERFLWVENFERATRGLEGHTGPFFYHFAVALLGGLPLVPMYLVSKREKFFANAALWKSWILVCLVLFSLAATKLPNYTWPVWPAICYGILLAIKRNDEEADLPDRDYKNWVGIVFTCFCGILSVGFLIAGFGLSVVKEMRLNARAKAALESIGDVPTSMQMGCVILAAAFGAFGVLVMKQRNKLLTQARVASAAGLACIVLVAIQFFVMPFVQGLMTLPLREMASRARAENATAVSLMGYASPAMTSAFGEGVKEFASRDELAFRVPGAFVVTPIWNADVCAQNGWKMDMKKSFFVMCRPN